MAGLVRLNPKLMGLFFSMETMVGQKYEEGLASLKAIAEKLLWLASE